MWYLYIGLIVAFMAFVVLFKIQNFETATVSPFSTGITLPPSRLIFAIYQPGMRTGGWLLALPGHRSVASGDQAERAALA
jgi:putative membrane protein